MNEELLAQKIAEGVAKYLVMSHNIYEPTNLFVHCRDDVYEIMKDFCDETENMFILCLDVKNRVIAIERLYRGTTVGVGIRIAEIFRAAIRYNAASIIVVHNHPSGIGLPSDDDRASASEILKAAKILDIEVLDQLVLLKDRVVPILED